MCYNNNVCVKANHGVCFSARSKASNVQVLLHSFGTFLFFLSWILTYWCKIILGFELVDVWKLSTKKLLETSLVCFAATFWWELHKLCMGWALGLNLNPSVIHQRLKISEHTINNSPSAGEASERPTQSSLKLPDKLNPVQFLFY